MIKIASSIALILFAVLMFLIFSNNSGTIQASGTTSHASHDSQQSSKYMGSHGMALLLSPFDDLIAHHLPLYRAPHDYQILYKVSFTENNDIISEMAANGLVTILPDNFDLKRLIDKNSFSINATIYDGHFERGGKALFTTNINFEKAVYVRQIILNDSYSETQFDITYVSKDTQLAIHVIDKKPSFDALVWMINTGDLGPNNETAKKTCNVNNINDDVMISSAIYECLSIMPSYLELDDFK